MRYIVISTILFLTVQQLVLGKTPNFSSKNLTIIPSYERYEFEGINSKGTEIPVVFEYKAVDINGKNPKWIIKGKLKLNKTLLNETYTVDLKNLYIAALKRSQKFDRGENKTTIEYDVDVSTKHKDEFIISTVQGLMYLLRTFPFESEVKEITVRAPQQEKGKLNFKVKNKGLKPFESKKFGTIDVYHLELSLKVPAIGGLIPKLNFYIRNDARKTLIALKGKMLMTNTELDVELVEYESKL